MAQTVADQFANALADVRIKRIYGIVGDSLNGLTDAIRRGKHRMASRPARGSGCLCGWCRGTSDRLAVCAGSCGPGNLHLINGLFDCHRSRAPVLAIAAHIPSAEIGGSSFQESHPEILINECGYYCELVSGANQVPRMLEAAIREALGKRGVSLVVIPGDVALRPAADTPPPKLTGLRPPRPVVLPTPPHSMVCCNVEQSSAGDRSVRLPLRGAHDELLALSERLKSPIVHPLRGKEHV